MSDESDQTIIRRAASVLRRERYPDDRREPQINWMSYLPLALAILGGVVGYVRTQAHVEILQRDVLRQEATHKEDMTNYKDWNTSISERLRELERE